MLSSAYHNQGEDIMSELPEFISATFNKVDSPEGKILWNNRLAWSLVERIFQVNHGMDPTLALTYPDYNPSFIGKGFWEEKDSEIAIRLATRYIPTLDESGTTLDEKVAIIKALYGRVATHSIASEQRTRRWRCTDTGQIIEQKIAITQGMFPLLSRIPHSDDPNCTWHIPNKPHRPIILRARCDIIPGEPLTVQFCDNTLHKKTMYSLLARVCASCSSGSEAHPPFPLDGKRCSGCGVEWYCSRICQKKHWKQHKESCGPFKQYHDDEKKLARARRKRRKATVKLYQK
jgi:hypothetical protein